MRTDFPTNFYKETIDGTSIYGYDGWYLETLRGNDKGQLPLQVSPYRGDFKDVGTHKRFLKFTFNGQDYTVPVTFIIHTQESALAARGELDVVPTINFAGYVGEVVNPQALKISSTGDSLLWTSQVDTAGQRWLRLDPVNGQTGIGGGTNLIVDMTKIDKPGKYTAKVTLVDENKKQKEVTVFLNASGSSVEPTSNPIQVQAIEVTQGSQNLLNEMPLVAFRKTVVRVHLRSTTQNLVKGVNGVLKVRTDQGEQSYPAMNKAITVKSVPDRWALNDSLYFIIPKKSLNGKVTLSFTSNTHTASCNEFPATGDTTTPKNDCQITVFFKQYPRVPLTFWGGRYTDGAGKTYTVSQPQAKAIWRDVGNVLPLRPWRVEFKEYTSRNVPTKDALEKGVKPGGEFYWHWQQQGNPKGHSYFIFDGAQLPGKTCYGSNGGFVGACSYAEPGKIHDHEIAHNFGLGHAYKDGLDPKFPAYLIDKVAISEAEVGPKAYYGFDLMNTVVHHPRKSGDVLGISSGSLVTTPEGKRVAGQWISDFTYRWILKQRETKYTSSLSRADTANVEYTVVSGWITSTTSGSLSSAYGIISQGEIPTVASGDYAIRLERSNGEIITTVPFGMSAGEQSFGIAVPGLIGNGSAVARIVLLYQNTLLATLTPIDGAPAISAVTIQRVEKTDSAPIVEVNASIQDTQPVLYALAYSTNAGTTWQTVASDESTNGSIHLEIDTEGLPGAEQHQWRLSVSDGFYTVVQTKSTVFSIPASHL